MSEWIFCQSKFIEADVIRWQEPVWEKRGPRQGRAVHIGDRIVTAEVICEDQETGYITLLVLECRVIEDKTRRLKITPLQSKERIRRKRSTLEKGKPERMLWTDESARAELVGGERNGWDKDRDRL